MHSILIVRKRKMYGYYLCELVSSRINKYFNDNSNSARKYAISTLLILSRSNVYAYVTAIPNYK